MDSRSFDETIRQYTLMMVNKIRQVGFDWEQPWFNPGYAGVPQNLSGRHYQGINSILLTMEMENKGYETPVFMTAAQASMEHVSILKNEDPLDVVYWTHEVHELKTGKSIAYEDFEKLDKAEKLAYQVTSEMKAHRVYNIQQTDFPKIQPELWKNIKNKFTVRELMDEEGMYRSPLLDVMIKEQKWICPIITEMQDKAFYTQKGNPLIVIPEKGQFNKGEDFYATLLHEMAHSTGSPNYLSRNMDLVFGSKEYAREELIAELTSAISGKELGIFPNVREENAVYLKNWLVDITDNPEYLFSILAEVGKASLMIKGRIAEMNQYLTKEDRFISAAIQGNRQELSDLKKADYVPSMREIDMVSKYAKDFESVKAVKDVYNIDISLSSIKSENQVNDKHHNINRDNGIEL